MVVEIIRALYGYNKWATGRLLDLAAQLTPEQFLAPAPGDQRSLRDTLVHLVSTQRSWLSWWDSSLSANEAYALRLDPADFPDVAAIRRVWEEVERQTEAFLAGLSADDVTRIYTNTLPNGQEWRMQLWQMMLHVANHGTQHRSEVAARLTEFGHSPGSLDLIFYLEAR